MGSLELVPMHQLTEARRDDDDWTGLKDQKERRKRQTRLALRAYRKRKANRREAQSESRPQPVSRFFAMPLFENGTRACVEGQYVTPHAPSLSIPSYLSQSGRVVPLRYLYPISRDHLLPLVEYNVFRASHTNLLILGHFHLIGSDCRFGGPIPVFPSPYSGKSIPESLRLTPLQQSTTYPDWIDLLPSPRMRDNAIRAQNRFTNRDLCADLLGGLMGKQNDSNCGLIVWSNPWEAGGWELTEGFVKKWRFLVEGCIDLVQSTNQWRDLRGEEPLSWPSE